MLNLDDKRKEAYRYFLTAHVKLTEELDSALTAANLLPLTWYDVLVSLEMADNHSLRMSELADTVLLSRSGLTRLVDRLEVKGYVERRSCPADRRGFHCVLTPHGLKVREESWPLYSSLIQEMFGSQMTDSEVEEMTKIMKRIVDSVAEFRKIRKK